MQYIVGFVIGLAAGFLAFFIINRIQQKQSEGSFSRISRDALRNNSEEFLQLASQNLSAQTQRGIDELEAKKQLIDQTLQTIKTDLNKVEKLVNDAEMARVKSSTEIGTGLKTVSQQTEKLQDTTNKLQAALANTKIAVSGVNGWRRMY